jgi:hypothetical protein
VTVSLETAHTALRLRCRELVLTTDELVTIVHEDRPQHSEVAVVDHLVETVSELQAAAVQAAGAATLPAVDAALAGCRSTYWHRLAAFRPLALLRRAAREHDREWRAWQHSVEQSMARCESALDAAETALRVAWSEVAELVPRYLAGAESAQAPTVQTGTAPSTSTGTSTSTSTRRQP